MVAEELCTVNVSDQMAGFHVWMHMQLFVYGTQKWELNPSCSISPCCGYFSRVCLMLGTQLQSRCTPQCVPHHPCQHPFGKVDFEQERACRHQSCKHLGSRVDLTCRQDGIRVCTWIQALGSPGVPHFGNAICFHQCPQPQPLCGKLRYFKKCYKKFSLSIWISTIVLLSIWWSKDV